MQGGQDVFMQLLFPCICGTIAQVCLHNRNQGMERMNFAHHIPTRILFGAGSLKSVHKQNLPGSNALIVMSAGKSSRLNGALDGLQAELEKAHVRSVLFDKILPNPTKQHVMEGAELARIAGCDFVIGLGGGSSIDSAKAIAVMATNGGDYWDYINSGTGKRMLLGAKPLPIVAITTTAGTGTEADPWTVITNEESTEKIGFGTPDTFPVLAVVDPELMLTVPPLLTAYQGFDALFHSVEGYLCRHATPISDLYALKAIELVGQHLPTAVREGSDLAAREGMALANTLSGMVESTSRCISEHSLEHALSAFFPALPHGAGLIMISKAYYTHFAKYAVCSQRMIQMARALGCAQARTALDFVAALEALQQACGVADLRMSDYGIKKEDARLYAQNARSAMGHLFEGDPVALSENDCVALYEAAYR